MHLRIFRADLSFARACRTKEDKSPLGYIKALTGFFVSSEDWAEEVRYFKMLVI
jgi:hypothetical protein